MLFVKLSKVMLSPIRHDVLVLLLKSETLPIKKSLSFFTDCHVFKHAKLMNINIFFVYLAHFLGMFMVETPAECFLIKYGYKFELKLILFGKEILINKVKKQV